jgi:hypothetical protein
MQHPRSPSLGARLPSDHSGGKIKKIKKKNRKPHKNKMKRKREKKCKKGKKGETSTWLPSVEAQSRMTCAEGGWVALANGLLV